ncbi:hypothetical protein D5R81_09430 [Parashewanella spongiae]|uniref:Uncharacterized protein n=1 Tax=Parashewanella spongiae TaxID=342950 RepID=A0A3A6UCB0_9GAMM|nr:hypothetical protein [Parashewanella spongiae]MCL1078113.1 hypothetical protein [Parashewanella spongiae]RJY16359.1 hypothetical protein D5R81_09430 [Parashewanella spongiae]
MNNISDEQLNQLISELPKSINPKDPLWSEIEAKLDTDVLKIKNTKWIRLAIASSVLLAFFTGWQVNKYSNNGDALPNTAMITLIDELAAQHQQQVENFNFVIKPVSLKNGPLTRPIGAGIHELRNAAKMVGNQLRLNPNDKQLWELWLWLQSREIELLEQAQGLIETQTYYSI